MLRKILVTVDGSELAERVLPAAMSLAAHASAELVLLHVLERSAPQQVHSQKHLTDVAEAEAYLKGLAGNARAGVRVSWHVHTDRVGDVARSIVDHANEIGVDLIAMSTHGSGGLARLLYGSIAQQTLSHSRQPVLLCPVQHCPPVRAVFECRGMLIPVDIAAGHSIGTELGLELARLWDSAVTLVAVAPTPGSLDGRRDSCSHLQPATTAVMLDLEEQQLRDALGKYLKQAMDMGLEATGELLRGNAAAGLLEMIARDRPDVVVFATHRRKGLDAVFYKSVGHQLCSKARAYLVVAPIEG
ncbi:MAG: universal stress protein [Tepidisphaeraceae bacterium]